MSITRTYASICDDIRAQVDREGDPALDNTVLQPWIMQEIRKARVVAAKLSKDEYTETSDQFTIPSGNTFTIGAGFADSVTNLMVLRQVQVTIDNGVHWTPVPRMRLGRWGQVAHLSYVRRGRTLEFLPVELARLYPYRYLYVALPPEMPGEAKEMDFAVGEDEFVVAGVAARCRRKFEEDPVLELAAQRAAVDNMRDYFGLAQGPPEPMQAESGEDDEDV